MEHLQEEVSDFQMATIARMIQEHSRYSVHALTALDLHLLT